MGGPNSAWHHSGKVGKRIVRINGILFRLRQRVLENALYQRRLLDGGDYLQPPRRSPGSARSRSQDSALASRRRPIEVDGPLSCDEIERPLNVRTFRIKLETKRT